MKRQRVIGEWMLHPVVLLSIFVLAVNDHYLKTVAPGIISGKLSDVAGMIFFPFVLFSICEVVAAVFRRALPHRDAVFASCVFLSGALLASVNLSPALSFEYERLVELTWRAGAGFDFAARNQPDPTDLFALPFLLVPIWLYRRRTFRKECASYSRSRRNKRSPGSFAACLIHLLRRASSIFSPSAM